MRARASWEVYVKIGTSPGERVEVVRKRTPIKVGDRFRVRRVGDVHQDEKPFTVRCWKISVASGAMPSIYFLELSKKVGVKNE